MSISRSHNRWFLLALILGGMMLSLEGTAKHCLGQPCQQKCRITKSYRSYGGCPCFSSAGQLAAALGNHKAPNSCVSGREYSLLAGGTLTFTSQDFGQEFSCFFQNINEKTKKEVVEYGTPQEIRAMHRACDSVIRDFAANYKIKCK